MYQNGQIQSEEQRKMIADVYLWLDRKITFPPTARKSSGSAKKRKRVEEEEEASSPDSNTPLPVYQSTPTFSRCPSYGSAQLDPVFSIRALDFSIPTPAYLFSPPQYAGSCSNQVNNFVDMDLSMGMDIDLGKWLAT